MKTPIALYYCADQSYEYDNINLGDNLNNTCGSGKGDAIGQINGGTFGYGRTSSRGNSYGAIYGAGSVKGSSC